MKTQRGRAVRPAHEWLFGLLGRDAKADASVERHGFNQDIVALAIGVLPGAADARPEGVAVLPVADVVGDVARRFRGGRWGIR